MIGTFAVVFLGFAVQALLFIGLGALVLWARKSPARLGGVSVVFAVAIPLVPGLQETRTPQVAAYAILFALLLFPALDLLRARQKRLRLPLMVLGVLSGLPLLTVGVLGFDQFRLLAGLVVATSVALAISIGLAADHLDRQRLLRMLTFLAYVTAAIALYEVATGKPLYEFTNFQVQSNQRAAFRAASLFGHPLVLCVFMAFVAVVNMARPAWTTASRLFARFPSVGIPLAGAAASGSRSVLLMVGVGITAMLVVRRDGSSNKSHRFVVAVLAVVLGILGLQPGSLLSGRFDQLSTREQSIRLGGFDVVNQITTGAEIIVGGGPRSVADASKTYSFASFRTVDNQFFTAYADYGLIGVALVVGLICLVLVGVRRKGLDPLQRAMAVAGSIFLPAFFVMEPMSWPAIAVLFGFAVGSAVNEQSRTPDSWRRQLSREGLEPKAGRRSLAIASVSAL
ncbi:hypothetical protein ACX5I6_09750 [Arthrobacter sp. MMS24-T111]